MRKRSRIVVIDDSEFYYLTLFQRDGYTIEHWNDVKDLTKLEDGYFDLILLDIHGVGEDLSSDAGLGILRYIKRKDPTQVVVAYSNADWPLKYREFFDQADATLDKRSDYVEFKQVIDTLLAQRFTLDFYLERILALAPSSASDSARLRSLSERSILTGDATKLRNYLETSPEMKDSAMLVLQVVQTAMTLLQLLGGR